MKRYAQINPVTGRSISVSVLTGEIEAEHMILLADDQNVQPGDIYMNGEWVRPDLDPIPGPEPSPVERISALEAENAGMALELAQNQIHFNEMEQANADLLFLLVDKGVL